MDLVKKLSKKLKNLKENNNGITLIALVITIIFILIIVTVVINWAGGNKMLGQSKTAKEETIRGKEKEVIKLAYQAMEIDYNNTGVPMTSETYGDELKIYDNDTETQDLDESENVDEYEVVVDRTDQIGYTKVTFTKTDHLYIVALPPSGDAVKYVITYNANGGTNTPSPQEKIMGRSIKITADEPIREGYSFQGWSLSADAVGYTYRAGDKYADDKDITLYAFWKSETYNITYDLVGGTLESPNPATYGRTTRTFKLNNPTKQDMVFTGWTGTGLSNPTIDVYINTGSTGDKSFTATWAEPAYIVDETTYTATLKEALSVANASGSIIRTLKNTNETTESQVSKDVTLDLAGYTITENNAIKVLSDGKFKIKDSGHNNEFIGMIKNVNGTAIENEGTLTLGDNDGNIGLTPMIIGSNLGILNNGLFDFYDGQVTGPTAIDGENVITPDTYYAMATPNDNGTETVRLQQLGNAVAKVGYRYYSTLAEAESKVPDGEYANQIDNIMISAPTKESSYGFKYNADGNLTPENKGVHSTTANSYIKLDLTNITNSVINYTLNINATTSSETNYDFGYATLTGSTDVPAATDENGRFIYESGSIAAKDYTVNLNAGNVYYLHLGYIKDKSGNTGNDSFTINSIKLNDTTLNLNGTTNGVSSTISVPKENSTKVTLVSNVTVSSAPWTIHDLKNIKLDLNGKVISTSGSINTIDNRGKLEILDSSEAKIGRINNSVTSTIITNSCTGLSIDSIKIDGLTNGTYDKTLYYVINRGGYTNFTGCTYNNTYQYNSLLDVVNGSSNIDSTSMSTGRYCDIIDITNASTFNMSNSNVVVPYRSYGVCGYKLSKSHISNCTFKTTDYNAEAIYTKGSADMVVDNTDISIQASGSSTDYYAVQNNGSGTMTINGGHLTGYKYANTEGIVNTSNGTITINNYEMKNLYVAIANKTNGTLNINNSSITNSQYGIYNFKKDGDNGTANIDNLIIIDNMSTSSSKYAIYNNSNMNLRNSTINVTGSSYEVYGINNSGTGNIVSENSNITVNCSTTKSKYGSYNSGDSVFKIISGNVNSNDTAVYSKDRGKLIVGIKDGNVNSNSPCLEGTNYGLSTGYGGLSELYDGKFIGATAISATVNEIEDKSQIVKTTENGKEVAKITADLIDVAKIEATGVCYKSLQEAINACPKTGASVVTMLETTYVTNDDITINAGQDITVNLNGKDIRLGVTLNNNGKFKFEDLTTAQAKIYTNTIIDNPANATLEFNNVQYRNNAAGISLDNYTKLIYNKGTLNVSNSIITVFSQYVKAIANSNILNITNSSVLYNTDHEWMIQNNGVATITDSTISATVFGGYGIYNNSSSDLILNNSIVKAGNMDSYPIYNYLGKITINGGTIADTYHGSYGHPVIYNNTNSTVELNNNVSVESCDQGIENHGIFTVNSANISITTTSRAIRNIAGTFTINSGSVTSSYCTIENDKNANFIINDGDVSGTDCGIENDGNLTVVKGTINATGYSSAMGINNKGTTILGVKGEDVSIENPNVAGDQYGIVTTSGTLKFYDGIIRGKTNSINGSIAEIETGYDIKKSQNSTTQYYETILQKTPFIQIGENQYYTLQDAIDSIDENNTAAVTLTLLRDGTITSDINITNRKIKIDLAGKKIQSSNKVISNSEVDIIDSSADKTGVFEISIVGADYYHQTTCFENSGVLNINGAKMTSNSTCNILLYNTGTLNLTDANLYYSSTYIKLVSNKGALNVNNSTLNAQQFGCYGLYNDTTQDVILNNTIIKAGNMDSYPIYNNSGKIIINGGTVANTYRGSYGHDTISNYGTVEVNDNTSIESSDVGIGNYGTFTLNSGSIIMTSNSVAVTNYSNATFTMNDGTILSKYRTISNSKNGNFIMNNGTITGTEYGIENAGNVTIINGSVLATGYTYSNGSNGISNTGTLILGTKDGIVSTEIPNITADKYGIISTNGTLKMYDGIVKGKTDALNGSLNEMEAGYDISNIVDADSYHELTLKSTPLIQKGTDVYYTLQDAIDSVPENNIEPETLTCLRDGTITTEISILNRNIKLDLQDKKLQSTNKFTSNGTLEIVDSTNINKGTLEISIVGGDYYNHKVCFENTGILKLNGINMDSLSTYDILVSNNGTLDIVGTTFKYTTDHQRMVYNYGKLNITDSTLNAQVFGGYGIYNDSSEDVILNNSIIESGNMDSFPIYNKSGKIIVNGGKIANTYHGSYGHETIYNTAGSTIELNDNATIESSDVGIGNYGTFIINKGNIISTSYYAVYNYAGANFVMNSGLISKSGTYYSEKTILNYGTMNIKGGTVKTVDDAKDAIMNYKDLIIGTKGGEVTKDTPCVQGLDYGINNSGDNATFKFYDGTIKGKKATINGTINELEPNYQISTETDENGYFSDTLIPVGGQITVATVGSVNYGSIQDAVEGCTVGNEVIVLQKDVDYENSNLDIPADKNIIINLNGRTITSSSDIATIVNNGKLVIKDTSSDTYGTVENKQGVAIINNDTLSIGEDDSSVSMASPRIIGTTIGIKNNSVFNFYDGIISATDAVDGEITSTASGYNTHSSTSSSVETLTLEAGIMTTSLYSVNNNNVVFDTSDIQNVESLDGDEPTSETNNTTTYSMPENKTYSYKVTTNDNNVEVVNINK